jgi:hypothetical protein
VIDPAVPITHLDPDGVRRLMALVTSRSGAAGTQLTVLHDEGRVIGVVHSVDGHVDAHREDVTDPAALAAALLEATGVDRVVVLDRSRLDDVAAAVVDAARRLPSQGDLLLAAHDIWWSHPAVVTAPTPPLSSWAPVRDLLRGLPDGWIHLAIGPDPRLDAHLRLAGGWIAEITGRDPAAGPLLRLDLDWADLERIAHAPVPLEALLDHLDHLHPPSP